MTETVEILHRPAGWTTKVLFIHIEGVAERLGKSRREVDRMVDDGELTKVLIQGLSFIPAHELLKYEASGDGPDGDGRGRQTTGAPASPEAKAEYRAETAAATPWEDLTYETR